MQRANGTSACASCKHQRKKCTEKCILAPFFPVDKTGEFQAVHKVFGVSNVTKIVTNLKEEDRKQAVDSLIWEAFCRQKDPVLGPYGEYRRVCEELRLYKSQYQQIHQVQNQGNIVYKAAAQGLMGWNNNKFMSFNDSGINNNNINNNSLNNVPNNGNSVVDFCACSYSSHHLQETDKLRGEIDNGSALMPQQYMPNGFNQQYFVTSI
ncbi:LOB domain-containing protein 2 [Olea europaea var. sylvestris]|uniref:LOB domain-containing protein 2 n=1 Tax=Olea europaea var. sylvestris TaxID=158386 RepID=UPI000C1CD2B2|nr:LOB domain-containing protein 2 [Olea europaea var. sylvestris]